MSGYRPMGAGNAAAAKRAYAAARARHRAAQFQEYDAYRAEQRACGYEVEPFEEWLGEVSPRGAAEERVMGGMSYAQFNHFADLY